MKKICFYLLFILFANCIFAQKSLSNFVVKFQTNKIYKSVNIKLLGYTDKTTAENDLFSSKAILTIAGSGELYNLQLNQQQQYEFTDLEIPSEVKTISVEVELDD